jgi:mevalonate kinase
MKDNHNVIKRSRNYSNGKLLLTGEYFVLNGAKSLAVPTACGQDLVVEPINEPQLIWNSFTNNGECWLEAIFDLPKLRLVSATFEADEDGGNDTLAEKLKDILVAARNLNSSFLNSEKGVLVKTNLTFPKNWGLGTSSTLINNLANWADVNPYELLKNTFGGSGYDIACAKYNTPILFTNIGIEPIVEKVNFKPLFKDQLYFVYLNKKQNSREGIQRFKQLKGNLTSEIKQISELTDAFVKCDNLKDFDKLLIEHEKVVSKTIQLKTVQEKLFSDYFGQTKSLGAWGGDFILATGNNDTPNYFNKKGFHTVIPYRDLVLQLGVILNLFQNLIK